MLVINTRAMPQPIVYTSIDTLGEYKREIKPIGERLFIEVCCHFTPFPFISLKPFCSHRSWPEQSGRIDAYGGLQRVGLYAGLRAHIRACSSSTHASGACRLDAACSPAGPTQCVESPLLGAPHEPGLFTAARREALARASCANNLPPRACSRAWKNVAASCGAGAPLTRALDAGACVLERGADDRELDTLCGASRDSDTRLRSYV